MIYMTLLSYQRLIKRHQVTHRYQTPGPDPKLFGVIIRPRFSGGSERGEQLRELDHHEGTHPPMITTSGR